MRMARSRNIPGNFGQPLFWHTPHGVRGWVPTGPPRIHGPDRVQNPIGWRARETWYARILVGLYVNNQPRWKVSDVSSFVQSVGVQGASFVSQRGLWHGSQEKSVQVVIFNAPPQQTSLRDFKRNMIALAEMIARAFQQDEVIVDVQKSSGRTYGVKP